MKRPYVVDHFFEPPKSDGGGLAARMCRWQLHPSQRLELWGYTG